MEVAETSVFRAPLWWTTYPLVKSQAIWKCPLNTTLNLRIADATGRILIDLGQQQLRQGQLPALINVHQFSPGLYHLLVQRGDEATSLPLQVVR